MDDLTQKDFAKALADATTNRTAILMFEDKDGNWRGIIHKQGKNAQARQGSPQTVLTLLLTHE